jgi:hypothetical protein
MKYSPLFAAICVLSTAPADAEIITETITFTATDFLHNPAFSVPVEPVTGMITVSFDPTPFPFGDGIRSVHLDDINILPSIQDATFTLLPQGGEVLCWSWQPGPYGSCGVKAGINSFFLQLTGPLTDPGFFNFVYAQADSPGIFSSSQGSVQVVPAPIAGAGIPGLILAGAGLLLIWRRKWR